MGIVRSAVDKDGKSYSQAVAQLLGRFERSKDIFEDCLENGQEAVVVGKTSDSRGVLEIQFKTEML